MPYEAVVADLYARLREIDKAKNDLVEIERKIRNMITALKTVMEASKS